jgi:cytochrome P450
MSMPAQTDGIDLSDLAFWARPLEDREAAFAALRGRPGLAFFEEPDLGQTSIPIPKGPGYYAAVRHADVLEASRTPEVFCSGRGASNIPDLPPEFLDFFGSMINADDPRHARLRRIVSAGFTPRLLDKLEHDIQRAATGIVDRVIDRGECDFVTDVAARLPLKIICDMMGIPEGQYDTVFAQSNVILGAADPEYVSPDQDAGVALLSAGQQLATMVQELGAHREQHPTDDLISALVQANVDGERLTPAELASFFILLVVAGNETTRNAIGHGLNLLTEHPDQRAAWQADFEGVAPTAVEEIVRYASPVIFMRRTTTRPTRLGGEDLPEASKVVLFYWSANRDETVFEDPLRFDVRRKPNDHVGFGGPGPHFCLGAHLARREITVMYRELFSRVPDIEASGPPVRLLSAFINGIKRLPCTFTPGRKP